MRYVLIVMLLFSASAQAEEWEQAGGTDFYVSELQLNVPYENVLVKFLRDNIDDSGKSSVVHYQFECAHGKPLRERVFYYAFYTGRMATGNVEYFTKGAPWIPFESKRFQYLLEIWCGVIEDSR